MSKIVLANLDDVVELKEDIAEVDSRLSESITEISNPLNSLFKTEFIDASGELGDISASNERRWFFNKVIPSGSYIEDIKLHFGATLGNGVIELWEIDNNVIRIVNSISFENNADTKLSVVSIPVNSTTKKDTYVSFKTDTTFMRFQTKQGANYLLATADMNSTELRIDSIVTFNDFEPKASLFFYTNIALDKISKIETEIDIVDEKANKINDEALKFKGGMLLKYNSENDVVRGEAGTAYTRRWFVDNVFPSGSTINFLEYNNYDGVKTIYFEIWEDKGNTFDKVKTVASRTSGYGNYIVEFNHKVTNPCMIAWVCPNTGSVSYKQVAGEKIGIVTDNDTSLSTINKQALGYYEGLKASIRVEYSVVRKNNVVFIGTGMDYEQIQDALENITDDTENNRYTFVITPSDTPYRPFSMIRKWGETLPWSNKKPRYIDIVGMDKNRCVVESKSGNYLKPCGEPLTNGIFKNLTFIMNHEEQDTSATQGGYCLHIDCATMDDVGYDMTFEDCDFYDDNGPCIGIGMHQNCNLTFKRCTFKTTLTSEYSPYDGYRNLYDFGCFFAHTDTHDNVTGQNLNIIDCIGTSLDGGKSLWLATAGQYTKENSEFVYTLLRNVFWCKGTNSHGYTLSGGLTPNPMNFGNNK